MADEDEGGGWQGSERLEAEDGHGRDRKFGRQGSGRLEGEGRHGRDGKDKLRAT